MVTIQQVAYTNQEARTINNEIAAVIDKLKKDNNVYKIGIQTIPGIIVGVNGSNPIIVGRTGILFFDTSNYGKILSVEVNERVFNSLRTVDTFYFRLDIIAEEVE